MTLSVRLFILLAGTAMLAGCEKTKPSGTSPSSAPVTKPEPKEVTPVVPPEAAEKVLFRELTAEQAKKYPDGLLMAAIEPADTWTLREIPSDEEEKKKDEKRRKDFEKEVKDLKPADPADQVKIREAAIKVFGKENAEKIGVLLRVDGNPKYLWP